jgi:3-isopropylmalate/(R)-2-methylmalate dehydratase small subunit
VRLPGAAPGPRVHAGRAWVFGDDIDTDLLAPGRYMKGPIEELARHCLEALDPAFARSVRPGDILVAGESLGIGSSREQAVLALQHLGIRAVLARSFGRIFYRNAVNLGLPVLVCPDLDGIRSGDELRVDLGRGTVEHPASGRVRRAEPLPPHLLALIEDGGLLPHLEKRLRARRLGDSPACP